MTKLDDHPSVVRFRQSEPRPHPGRIDFLYFAFTIAVSFAVSDVTVTRRDVRWQVTIHSGFGESKAVLIPWRVVDSVTPVRGTVEEHLATGDTLRQALLRSGRRRLRPVLMTSLAANHGMLPLALALGSGAELLQPLAIAVIGGLAVALLFSLVVTPTVYAMLKAERGA